MVVTFVNPLDVSRTIGVNSQDSISTGRSAILIYVVWAGSK